MPNPPVCDYEGSDYQSSFWDQGGRQYEDRVEAIALKRLLPRSGRLLLEIGAGAGRNTLRYAGFERIVLLDYSYTQLQQAQARLGGSDRYVYVAADAYRLPFTPGLFDAATMIRVLHHMTDAPKALGQVRGVLGHDATFILEFANKLNFKAMLRYWMGRQEWSPFSREPVEFAKLNFDFHPASVRDWLKGLGFRIELTLAVSYFRVRFLKSVVPLPALVLVDSLLQWTGSFWQFTPSIFVRAGIRNEGRGAADPPSSVWEFFQCPECGHSPLHAAQGCLECGNCQRKWGFQDGIFDFRQPIP